MTYAESNYLGSAIAANNQASFTFSYLDVSEIRVDITVSGTTTTYTTSSNPAGFSIISPNQYVTLSSHPADSDAIRIYRVTDLDNTQATFVAGSAISANDLNNNSKQVLQASQESRLKSDTAVTTANSAATDAATAVSTANSATTTANSAVTTANTANTNATAAQTAATNAAASASAAQTSATAAQTSATAAQASATSAQASATAAASDAASALSTANTANTNASAAVTTANTASTTASSAVTTANTANTNASAAQTAASNAATDASNAQASATAAQTSATAAQTSATAAAASAAASQNVADAFTATGTPATALSVDVPIDAANGVKLPTNSNSYDEEGAIRYNTTLDKIEIRKGSGWSTAAGGATVSSTPPSLATAGDVWYDHDNGRAYVYYNDGDSNQWVEMNPSWNGYVADNSVTSAKIVDGTIVNADVNASAAIAGTKIDPDFGSQNVVTTGNVGVGTNSPSAKAEISGQSSSINLRLTGSSATAVYQDFYQPGSAQWGLINPASTDRFSVIKDGPSGTEYFTVGSTGNVGIGTTSPTQKLHIYDTNNAYLQLTTAGSTQSASGGFQLIHNGAGDLRANIVQRENAPMTFLTNDTERMRIDSSGRLLLGTTTEGYAGAETLTVANSFNAGITIRTGTSNNGSLAFSDGTSGADEYRGLIQYRHVDNSMHFFTNGIERARFNSNGFFKASNSGNYFNATGFYHEFYSDVSNNTVFAFRHAGLSGQQYGPYISTANDQNNTSNYFLVCEGGPTARAVIRSNGGFYNYQSNDVNLCDEREKKNIEPLDSTWGCLKNWELKKFHYNEDADTDDKRYGVIAQQVAPYCPEVITDWIKQKAKDAELDDDGNVITPAQEEIARIGVKEQQMMWMAIKALQEAQLRIETLETQNADLAARITALETN